METAVLQVDMKDGRVFRIFCANATQKKKTEQSLNKIKDKIEFVRTVTNGIHTHKQWKEIIPTL